MQGHPNIKNIDKAIEESKGFTLVEVLVSFIMMAIGFVAIWGLHMSSLKIDARNRYETEAVRLANERLEELRCLSFTDPKLVVKAYDPEDIPSLPNPAKLIKRITSDTARVREISITVEWKEPIIGMNGDRSLENRTVTLETIIVDLSKGV